MHGRGPAFSCRSTGEAAGRSSAATRAYRTCAVDCPAGLIAGVLALYPQAWSGSRTRSRSSFPSTGCDGSTVAPQMPVYSRHLPTPTCAGTAVNRETAHEGKTGCHTVKVNGDERSSPPCRSLRSRLRKGAPRPAPLPLNCSRSQLGTVLKKFVLPSAEEFQQRVEERAETVDLSIEEVTQLVQDARSDDR